MKLFTNGCSWTYGGGLNLEGPAHKQERLQRVWPHHLGKLLGCEKVTNLAMGCGSNQRIFRTTFDWLIHQSEEELSDTIAVIQFTEPSRFEFNIDDMWYNCKIGCVTFGDDRITNHTENLKVQDLYSLVEKRFITYSDIEAKYSLLSSAICFDNLFKKFKIKDWYFWSFSHDFCRSDMSQYYFDSFKIIDKHYRDIIWNYSRIGTKFFEKDFDPHPDYEGHEQIAKALFYEMETYK